jgi:lipopolysaccharide export system permease protein
MYHTCAMKITLYRSILREVITPFFLGLMAFTAVLLMGRMVRLTDLVIAKGVPLSDVLWLVAYLLPGFATVTLPMALLLGVLLAFGRLSSDSETTAMKSCGVSLYGMLPPVMAVALLATAATAIITLHTLPTANIGFRRMLHDIIETRANLAVKEKVFNDSFPNITIYTDTYDEQKRLLGGVLINDERDRSTPLTIFARTGTIASDQQDQNLTLRLENGTIHQHGEKGGYRLVSFGSYVLAIDLQKNTEFRISKEDQLTMAQLKQEMDSPQTPVETRRLQGLEYHSRFALPAACLIFALTGVPLGMQNRRSGRAGGFALAIGVIISYFVLMSVGKNLGRQGLLPTSLAMWLPNLFFLLLGVTVFWFAATERTLPLLDRLRSLTSGKLFRRRAP